MGLCNCSVFCCALLCLNSSFAIISMGKRERAGCFALFVFVCLMIVVWLFHDATGLSAVCGCGFLIILTYYYNEACRLSYYINVISHSIITLDKSESSV